MGTVETGGNGFISQSNKKGLRNPWVIGLVSLLTVVIAVNIGFITMAIISNPGLVNKNYYEQGRYEERHILDREAMRKALAWTVQIDVPRPVVLNATQTFRFHVVDKNGKPVHGARVQFSAYRPSDADADFHMTMPEAGPGVYSCEATFRLKGIWDLLIHVERNGKGFDVPRRISVRAD